VVDPNGNARESFYTTETNNYLFDSTGATPGTARVYTRGGYLAQVGYSSQSGNVYAHIPMRVMLQYGDRCLSGSSCSTHTAQFWPDTPWDLSCSGSGCGATGHEAPSFWTQNMLSSVTAQVWEGSAGYVNVDSWSLGHRFLSADTNDLWLSSITHTGQDGGSAALPSVTITQDSGMPNRVAGDGYGPMYKYRVANIALESGEQIAVAYNAANCGSSRPSPSTDTLPCFEQWWTPGDPQANDPPVDSWFYKYPVASIAVHDNTNASTDDMVTSYKYVGGTAWHYDNDSGLVPNKYKSYSQWRGYQQVHVVTGSSTETQSETDYTYMRGMDGDVLPGGAKRSASVADSQGTSITDSERLNGFLREEIVRNGPDGPEVSGSITDPWQSAVTANSVKSWGTLTARMDGVAATHGRTDLATGGVRRTEVDNTFNSQGLLTQTSDLGDLSTTDRFCTTSTYAQSTAAWMLDYVSEEKVSAAACGSSGALISDTRHLYDGGGFGAAPTHGNVTETDQWSANDPGVPDHWVAALRETYDSFGRMTSSQDAAGNTTGTAYTTAYGAGNATTQTVVTNPLGFTSTTDLDAGRGLALDTVDTNGRRADLTYDPLGRLTAVWEPGQSKAAGDRANLTFAYQVSPTAPAAVTTNRLIDPNGLYVTNVAIYDGLLRARQTQRVAEAVSGAMLVTDTLYDSRGEVVTQNSAYAVSGTPSATLYGVSQSQVPSYTVSAYDGAGRKTADALYWQTTTAYGGDRVGVTPPQGGVPTTTITDARGRTTELDQYHASTPSGAFDATTYTYAPAGQRATVTDGAGNRWSFTYDLRGRKIKSADPDTGITTTTYDDLGQVTSTTDARGRTISTTHDALGRKTAEYDTTGGAAQTTADQVAAWTYDSIAGAKGQAVSSTSFSNGNAYRSTITGYDGAYRPSGTQLTIPSAEGALAGTYTFGASYNVDGTLATESLPAAGGLPAETVNHTYDNLGQPASTWGSGTSDYVQRTLWTPDLQAATYDLGLSQNAQWSALNMAYDPATHRLTETTVQRESNNWANDADFKYTFDNSGNVSSSSEAVAGDYQCFTYDYLRRLTQAWAQGASGCSTSPSATTLGGPSPYLEQLAYDVTGNRTSDNITYGPNNSVDYPQNTFPAAGSPQPHTLTSQQVVSSAYGFWNDTRG
jgi:YD repeat-containing protein